VGDHETGSRFFDAAQTLGTRAKEVTNDNLKKTKRQFFEKSGLNSEKLYS